MLREIDLPGAFRGVQRLADVEWFQPAGHRESLDRDSAGHEFETDSARRVPLDLSRVMFASQAAYA
jgi:hypothetical protein